MKSLSGDASDAVEEPLGEEPILVIKVDWSSGSLWYADRDLTLHAAKGAILNSSSLAAQVKDNSVGSVGQMSFTMADDDLDFKDLLDTCCAESTPVTVYQCFESARAEGDLILLLKGVMISPEWHEGNRTFSFGVETKVQDLEIGFAIEQADYDGFVVDEPLLTDEAIGRAWPLCFGSNVHEPGLKLLAPPETSLNGTYQKGDTHFFVEDASKFPTDSSIDVIIDGMVFQVTADHANNRMNVGDPNVPKYQSIPFAAREADEDENNPWVGWISQDVSLVNTFIFFTSATGNLVYHRVLRQEGRKIWLDNRVVQRSASGFRFNTGFSVVPIPLGPPTIITQVARYGRDGWGIEMSYVGGATTSNGRLQVAGFRDTVQVISGVTWKFASGEPVRLWSHPAGSSSHPVKYVVNLIPCTTVKAVYAWRTNPKTGQRSFKAVPSSYYTVTLSDLVFGQTCTTVTLKAPLRDYFAQGWEENLYFSHKSSVGPNAANIIKWLLENYSNIAVDAASFAAVAAKLTNYPNAKVFTSKVNVISACEDLAWKNRCALLIEDGVAKIKYLSEEPTSDITVDADLIEHKSLVMTNTRVEEITTHFRANWWKDHSGRPNKHFSLVKTENVSRFGLAKREVDFDCFNVKSLVEKSASFWAHRMANAWREAKLNLLKRTGLTLEMLDCVTVDYAIMGSQKGVLLAHSYDADQPDQTTFGLSIWLPWLAGTTVQDPLAWVSDAGDTLPADPVDSLSETTIDEQWADDLSHSFVNHRPVAKPAKIVNESADNLGFNVDVYEDGYEDEDGNDLPPTNRDSTGARLEFVAYPIDLAISLDRQFSIGLGAGTEKYRNILPPGTKIQIFNVHGARWMFNVPADRAHVLGRINGPTLDALGRIGVTLYPDGFDEVAGETQVKAYYAGDIDNAQLTDKGLLLQHGEIKVFWPLGSKSNVRWFKLSAHLGAGLYSGDEYDGPYGVALDDGAVSNLAELNGSTKVPNTATGQEFWVQVVQADTAFLYFEAPYGC